MQNVVLINNQEVRFEVVSDQTCTTSLIIANVFEKRHSDIIAKIEDLPQDDFNERNFTPVKYIDKKGETRPMYNLTRDGFTMLAMGFTGERAYQFKVQFINAFNKMESLLKQKAPLMNAKLTETITALNQKSLELDSFKSKYYESLEREVKYLNEKLENIQSLKPLVATKTGVGVKFSKLELKRAKELYEIGYSFTDIARELNRDSWTISRHLKKAGVR